MRRYTLLTNGIGARHFLLAGAVLLAFSALGLQTMVGCAPNDPFDPEGLENIAPTVSMSVLGGGAAEVDTTSYFNRTFNWHGADQDGWVLNFDLSIRLLPDVPAPWVTTTGTDTLMTLDTDDNGNAEVVFYLVARDNRGALSDTLVQKFPLANAPPAITFAADFDPFRNLQREIVAPGDTVYWNWGHGNFRLSASDRDGPLTMDQFYRYTFSDTEPEDPTGYPDGDPVTQWVQKSFDNGYDPSAYFKAFEIWAENLAVGQRTLTVSILDQGGSDSRFVYTWEVRAPRSNILYIPDNSSSIGRQCYKEFLDDRFGVDAWDSYGFLMGYPDRHATLLAVMREYDAVLWSDGGSTSDVMVTASAPGGALQNYIEGEASIPAGRFMLVSSVIAGNSSGLNAGFRLRVLNVERVAAPQSSLSIRAGKQALGELPGLLPLTSRASSARGIGLVARPGAENLYRMEECLRCYQSRPPYDPVVAVRTPERLTDPLARTISIGVQLEYFDRAEVLAALNNLFDVEMGVTSP